MLGLGYGWCSGQLGLGNRSALAMHELVAKVMVQPWLQPAAATVFESSRDIEIDEVFA